MVLRGHLFLSYCYKHIWWLVLACREPFSLLPCIVPAAGDEQT